MHEIGAVRQRPGPDSGFVQPFASALRLWWWLARSRQSLWCTRGRRAPSRHPFRAKPRGFGIIEQLNSTPGTRMLLASWGMSPGPPSRSTSALPLRGGSRRVSQCPSPTGSCKSKRIRAFVSVLRYTRCKDFGGFSVAVVEVVALGAFVSGHEDRAERDGCVSRRFA